MSALYSPTMQLNDLLALTLMRRALASGEAKELRIDARLSRAEVAELLGVTPEAVMKWELGERVPRGQPARSYASLLVSLRSVSSAPGHGNQGMAPKPPRTSEGVPDDT